MKKVLIFLLIILLTFTVIACKQSNESMDNEDSLDTSEVVTISGVLGDVELEGPVQNVVALEWTYAEDLLAVGVQPVGVADIEGYNSWVQIEEKLDQGVVDIGTRQEPSLEKIAELNPDLIIAIKFRHE